MDVSQIMTAIGSVGFLDVACEGMGWFIATTFRDFNNLMTKNNVLTEELIGLLQKDTDNDKPNVLSEELVKLLRTDDDDTNVA